MCFRLQVRACTYEFSLSQHVAAEADVLISQVDVAHVLQQAANARAHNICDRIGGSCSAQSTFEVIKYFLLLRKCGVSMHVVNTLNFENGQNQHAWLK